MGSVTSLRPRRTQRARRGGRFLGVAAQLDLADLLAHGAAQLAREAPAVAGAPAVASRVARVLGERLPCEAVIHWVCPVCRARTVTRWRCGPRCSTCGAGAPASASLLRRIPRVPVRHWVLSLPSPQRFELAGDRRAEAALVRAFVRAIFARLRACEGDPSAGCGAVVAIHRSGSALDLNLHVHALVVDGVFQRTTEGSRFVAHAPSTEDLAIVARAVGEALERLPDVNAKDPALASLQRAARPRRTVGRAPGPVPRAPGIACEMSGLRVFAGAPVEADDRGALRRVCEYVTRPAAARLASAEGTREALLLPLPPQPDGTSHAALSARDAVARLVAATPSEPAISVRTFGVLAPRAAHDWQLSHGRQLALPEVTNGRSPSPPRPRSPRCARCDIVLEAVAVEDASDPPTRQGAK